MENDGDGNNNDPFSILYNYSLLCIVTSLNYLVVYYYFIVIFSHISKFILYYFIIIDRCVSCCPQLAITV